MSRLRGAPLALLLVLASIVASLGIRGAVAGAPEEGVERIRPVPEPAAGPGRFVPLEPSGGTAPRAAAFGAAVDGLVARWVARAAELDPRARRDAVRVAVHVEDAESASELVARRADVPLRPASNMKLVTTAGAQVLFGATGSFVTLVEAGGPVEEGTLLGDLVVRAGGDPLYVEGAGGRVEDRLDALVRDLRAAGIRRVAGDLVLDEGRFPEPGPGPEWPPTNQHWQESCALAGGFTVNAGVLVARVEPRAVGQSAIIEVHPSPHGLAKRYGVQTVSRSINDVRVGATESAVTVRGELGSRLPVLEAGFAHPDPVGLYGAVLADRLARGDIRLEGRVRRERGAPGGRPLAEMRSPVAEVLGPINRLSVNALADQLFFALGGAFGGAPDREGGSRAVRQALEDLGVPTEGLVQVDGSGLSRANRITARQLTTLVRAALARDADGAFRDSLAVGGVNGTLEDRMQGPEKGRVHAKSGWIRGTSALSGVAVALDGRERVFSILVEYPAEISGLNNKVFKPMQDELVRLCVEGLE